MKRAVVLADGRLHLETAMGSLAAAGFETVTAPTVSELRGALEAGAQAAVIGVVAGQWEAEQARAIAAMPAALRRGCLVVLVGEGLSTGDGARAFLLGVDLVVKTNDVARIGELLSRALVAKRCLVNPLDPVAAARMGG
ncbi:MAG: hypothetical protein V1750_09495 [Acidobacteriota bacterium]